MKLRQSLLAPALLGLSLGLAAGTSSAAGLLVETAYTVTYDNSTSFGDPSFTFSAGALVGFGWNFSTSVQAVSFGDTVTAVFDMPDFTVTANPGWLLNGPFTGFLGNVVFNEVGAGATTSMTASAGVVMDALPPVPLVVDIDKFVTASGTGFESGYYAENLVAPVAGFDSISFSGGTLTLTASGGAFASIIAQPQNELSFSFLANPVPEPQTYLLFLAGLAAVGWMAQRRAPR